MVAAKPPVSTVEAQIDDRGALILRGYFVAAPHRVTYEARLRSIRRRMKPIKIQREHQAGPPMKAARERESPRMRARRNRTGLAALVAAICLLGIAASDRACAETASPQQAAIGPDFRVVSFDEAMKNQLARSMPLQLAFPADYAMLMLEPGYKGVVWAPPQVLRHLGLTQEYPSGSGRFHGRLTLEVGYDSSKQSFICGPTCDEAKLETKIKAVSKGDVRLQKRVVNGIPMLLIEASVDDDVGRVRRLYMAYIAVLIDTNVMLITYLPPVDAEDDGRATWQAFTAALTSQTVAVEPVPAPPSRFKDDLARAARSATFRSAADAFIAAAASGDEAKCLELISWKLIRDIGRDTLQEWLTGELLPFFSRWTTLGNSPTIAPTTDAYGNDGFVFYLTMRRQDGDSRPFAVYVIEENGAKVIANVVPDRDAVGDRSR